MRTLSILSLSVAVLSVGLSPLAEARSPRRAAKPASVDAVSPTAGVVAANAAAIREPEPGSYLNAVQVYTFVDGAIYRLFTAPDRVSDIVLQSQEQLIAISAGDTARWVIGDTVSGGGSDRQVHILVKPFTAGLKTNLVVTTSRRTYHLELESTPRTAMAAMSWRYPQDEAIKRQAEPAPVDPAPVAPVSVTPETLNFGYLIKGASPAWRPLRAFDDGAKTYIEFPATLAQTELPPLYVMGEGGAAELATYRLSGRYFVIDRLFRAAELRMGGKRQTVVKIAKTGGGHD